MEAVRVLAMLSREQAASIFLSRQIPREVVHKEHTGQHIDSAHGQVTNNYDSKYQ
jgi:hypothetical protein